MTHRQRLPVTAAALALGVAAVYAGTYRHEFLNYDDDVYITDNPTVLRGLSVQGLLWAFGYHAGNWHPLTWLSHMADAEIFGASAGGTHLVSAGIHGANAVLLLAVLAALTGAFWRSAAVAALFALHPLRVESVAWAAERKDVLSGLFWVLTLAAYLRYARRPGVGRYLGALGIFALGLMAKPMLVTLPFVLVLLDWWPLGRSAAGPAGVGRRSPGRCLAEKVPFLLLSLVSGVITVRGQTVDVLPMIEADPVTRLANAATSYFLYLRAFFWPSQLAVLYPFPREGLSWLTAAAATAALLLVSAAVVRYGRRRPYLIVGWFWYLVTLLPVIGIIQVGAQARNDRYTYLPLIGVVMALVWLTGDVWPRRAGTRAALGVAVGTWIIVLAAASAGYVRVWRTSTALFEHASRVTRNNFVALNNLGAALCTTGRPEEALAVLSEAVRIAPTFCNSHYWQGNSLLRLRHFEEAVRAYRRALGCYGQEQASPGRIADAYVNLGMALLQLGRWADAERAFRALLEIRPDDSLGRVNLLIALHEQGRR